MTAAIARDPIYRRRRFDSEIIELCVRWYLTYRLSYRDLVEMMAERGLTVSHTTIFRWVQRYVPEFERRWSRYAKPVHPSWRMDETAISVRGGDGYLYRAVDKFGKTVDSLLCADRTESAARAFFCKALQTHQPPDPPVDILVNNAGAALLSGFVAADDDGMDKLLRLNVLAPTLLTSAAISGMVRRGSGSIINISSVLALLPEYSPGIYAATKSFVLSLSQSLAAEVTSKGIYVQAVLPAATRTEIFERAGGDISNVPDVMEVEDLVDAALVGFDRKELVTIPPVPEVAAWEAFEQARGVLAQGFSNSKPASATAPDRVGSVRAEGNLVPNVPIQTRHKLKRSCAPHQYTYRGSQL